MGLFSIALVLGTLERPPNFPDGRTVKRLNEMKSRPYLPIFGQFELDRYVYGQREGRKVDLVPLVARLCLPECQFSFFLQDWDQSLITEEPFTEVRDVINRILGLSQQVDSLERMNRQIAQTVDEFHLEQEASPPQEEAAILVQTADGKGVPIRRPADAPAIQKHQHQRGPKPNRKTTEERETINATPAVFRWMADEVDRRNPDGTKEVVCIMDGQPSLWEDRNKQ